MLIGVVILINFCNGKKENNDKINVVYLCNRVLFSNKKYEMLIYVIIIDEF